MYTERIDPIGRLIMITELGGKTVTPSTFDPAVEVDFKKKKLIVVQCHNESNFCTNYVLVPGFRASKDYRKKNNLYVKVEPVSPKDQKAVEELLKNRFKGSINFW
jgi:hypothetical protein